MSAQEKFEERHRNFNNKFKETFGSNYVKFYSN